MIEFALIAAVSCLVGFVAGVILGDYMGSRDTRSSERAKRLKNLHQLN